MALDLVEYNAEEGPSEQAILAVLAEELRGNDWQPINVIGKNFYRNISLAHTRTLSVFS